MGCGRPHRPRANYDLVAICGSAGAIEALSLILAALPPDFEAPIVLVQHLTASSRLPDLLSRKTRLAVTWAEEGLRLRPGTVYVAPADRHLTVTPRYRCALDASNKVNALRPSGDVLLTSAAFACRQRTLGIVLTGYGRDGAAGARAIESAGGTVIAQEAAGLPWSGMPDAAIATGSVGFVLPATCIAGALVSLVTVPGIETVFPSIAPGDGARQGAPLSQIAPWQS